MTNKGNGIGFSEQKNALAQEIIVCGEQFQAPKTELIELASANINTGLLIGPEGCGMCPCPY